MLDKDGNSRDINDLQPYVAYLCRLLISKCKAQGITVQVTGTLRNQAYQTECYKKGTGPALLGPHGFGLAFDVVPVVNGKAIWDDNNPLWAKMGAIGKSIGLEWGGSWKNIIDMPHFQYIGGLTNAQIRAGKLPKFPPLPLEAQFRVYGSKPSTSERLGNGYTESYAITKANILKSQGYVGIYYIKPDGTKVPIK